MFFSRNKYINITQNAIESGYSWLETIVLVSDVELPRLNDWTVGHYHCKQCNAYQGFSHQLPAPEKADHSGELTYQPVSAKAHNERNAFWRAHAHGDGRIFLFEKDMENEDALQRSNTGSTGR